MTKQEFLEKLNNLLSDVPKTEREEAIEYYQEYFEDAGIGETEDVLEKIDAPEIIAATIKEDLESGNNEGEFTERGYYDTKHRNPNELMKNGEISNESEKGEKDNSSYYTKQEGVTDEKVPLSKSKVILIVLIAIFTFPIWGGLLGGLAGVILGLFAAALGIVVSVFAATLSLLIAGVVCIVVGLAKIAVVPIAGITTTGVGLLCFGLGLLFMMLTVWFCSFVVPVCFRGIRGILKRLFGGKGKR